MRPQSRGTIHLTGSDPVDPVSIDPHFLGDPQDLKELITGLGLAREIGNSSALRPFTGREVAPGPMSEPELEQFLRNGLGTHWHQSGTAKMGRDAMSVVDGKLKVHGVDGLRIADASIMPRVTTGKRNVELLLLFGGMIRVFVHYGDIWSSIPHWERLIFRRRFLPGIARWRTRRSS